MSKADSKEENSVSEILFSLQSIQNNNNGDTQLLGIFSTEAKARKAQLKCNINTKIESIMIETCTHEEKDTHNRIFTVFKQNKTHHYHPEWFFFNLEQAKFAQTHARGKCDIIKLDTLRVSNCLSDSFEDVYHYFTNLRSILFAAQAKFCKRVTDENGWSGHYWIGRVIKLLENQPIRSVSKCKSNDDFLELCAKAVKNSNNNEMKRAWETCGFIIT